MSTLAAHVRTLGRGPGRSRHLTRSEAAEAMAEILSGQAAPEAVGALLMLMRFRSENAEEIAGFVDALRAAIGPWPGAAPALDWPSYASGRSRGLPWFLLAARLVATAGIPVLLHGSNDSPLVADPVRPALDAAGIARAENAQEAADLIAAQGIAYLALEDLCPAAARVLGLRAVLGLRSPMNTALRLMNPAGAPTAVQGVFHPPYRPLQAGAGALLGQPNQWVVKGAGGEFERAVAKDVTIEGHRNGAPITLTLPALIDQTGRLAEGPARDDTRALAELWSGGWDDDYARAIVIGTAAMALSAHSGASDTDSLAHARALWADRGSA